LEADVKLTLEYDTQKTLTIKLHEQKTKKKHFPTDIFLPYLASFLKKVRISGGTLYSIIWNEVIPPPMALIFSNSFPPLKMSMWLKAVMDRILPSYLFFQLIIFYFFI